MAAGSIGLSFQYVFSAIAVFLNIFVLLLIVVVPTKLGSYKFFMIYFCSFELFYAVLGWRILMIFAVYDHRIVAFSSSDFLIDSGFGSEAIGLYCALYEVWMVYVAVMFLCRYVVVCRNNWLQRIRKSLLLKIALLTLYLSEFAYSLHCGIYWCTVTKIPERIERQVRFDYNKTHWKKFGAAIVTLINEYDQVSLSGFMSIWNHLFITLLTTICILFCGRKMQLAMKLMNSSTAEYARNRQIFITLVLQAVIPIFFYQIPSFSVILYAIVDSKSAIGPFLCQITLFFVIPKVLDPLCVIFIIKEYRIATMKILLGKCQKIREKNTPKICVSDSSQFNLMSALDSRAT